jgi:CubicO group peptidase (beta-lactamase class C family)
VFLACALAALSLAPVSSAQEITEARQRALAAGSKALFLCNGIFESHRTRAEVEAEELSRIYPEFRAIVPTLQTEVDPAAKVVKVSFAADLPPRIVAWRPLLGCTELPTGATPETIADLPRLDLAPPPGEPDKAAWPMGDAHAEGRLGADASVRLQHVLEAAFDGKSYGAGADTTGVVIVKDGQIVGERYRQGFDLHTESRTWSAAKSITGTLVGIAVKQGLLEVDAPADIPEWRRPGDPRGRITLANLLQMGSGLDSGRHGNRTDDIYLGGSAVTEKAVFMPLEAKPGTRWKYANDDALLAARSLHAAIGDDPRYLAFPYRELFWKIGMRHTTPETDWRGDYILSSQVYTTARDLARLGFLLINDGVWNGERLLPEGWMTYVTTPAPAQPPGADVGKSPGYGAQFWLWGPKQGLPEGCYAAEGSQGQDVMIVPSEHLVIVRRGLDGLAPGEAQFAIGKFSADVIAALK